MIESTAFGAAALAGLAVGFWKDQAEVMALLGAGERFEPQMDESERDALKTQWRAVVLRMLETR
ncbi:hypothetical protein [Rubritalea marina]|uniref:hypothetical protein n=1 Tax=Rubritalea marina TaxID=361055 RepID=UPI000363E309|nr:hypothetical protein [Rubritalea marina]